MKKVKKLNSLVLLSLSLGLVSCNTPTNKSSIATSSDPDYYNKINERAKFDNEGETNFSEDFTNGMNNDTWYAIDGSWHTDSKGWEHNGVQSRNLYYTKDSTNNTYLAIKAQGFYNETNRPEGGCIISKKHLGPGRYEITMASMPREGGVTAMWSYCTTTGNEVTSQNEIDIELGGTSSSGTQFEEYWTTSWTTRTNKQTDKVDVTSVDGLNFFLNDGKMHKYTYDWYTEYPGEDGGRVDWFIDGVFTKSISGSMIPQTEMPLWIGVWFPPAWAGNPAFSEDYLLIDKVEYTSFTSDSQFVDSCRSEAGYTKHNPKDLSIPTIPFSQVTDVNKLSNGTFDKFDICPNDQSYYGWKVEEVSKGTLVKDTDGSFKLTAGTDDGSGYFGEYINQKVSNAFEGFKYSFSIDAKKLDATSEGNIEIYFKNKTGKNVSKKTIAVTDTSYKTYTQDIVMPKGSSSIEIHLTSENGSVNYDNASLIFKK